LRITDQLLPIQITRVESDWSEAFELLPNLQVAYVWHASKFTREGIAHGRDDLVARASHRHRGGKSDSRTASGDQRNGHKPSASSQVE
jgi:hypothetical protein